MRTLMCILLLSACVSSIDSGVEGARRSEAGGSGDKMEVHKDSLGGVKAKQKQCPPKAERKEGKKNNPQVAVGVEKSIGGSQNPNLYTKFDECGD